MQLYIYIYIYLYIFIYMNRRVFVMVMKFPSSVFAHTKKSCVKGFVPPTLPGFYFFKSLLHCFSY